MSYEPPLDDDIALGKDEEEEEGYEEPDRMWGDEQFHLLTYCHRPSSRQ